MAFLKISFLNESFTFDVYPNSPNVCFFVELLFLVFCFLFLFLFTGVLYLSFGTVF